MVLRFRLPWKVHSNSLSCSALMRQSFKILRDRPGAAETDGCLACVRQENQLVLSPVRVPSRLDGGGYSCRYGYPLNSDKLQVTGLMAFYFEAELDGFADFHHELIERGGVGVAPWQLGHRGDVNTLFVLLDHDIKLARHNFHSTLHEQPSLLHEQPNLADSSCVKAHRRPIHVAAQSACLPCALNRLLLDH